MNKTLSLLPIHIQNLAPVQDLIKIVETQSKQIQSQNEQLCTQAEQLRIQTKQIQAQAEQVVAMQKVIEQLKDEISRLSNTPKRPKFRSGGMEPRDRSKKTLLQNANETTVLSQG